ncbi:MULTISPECIES: BadF/BadG/BcrA/BcrD ATPase family protein [unclassified Cyanobium]|uniref:BadF/BadG/BcrA/BcrD ATPase family protein n=1 Tax=unclassified Cyanobium TaxID=2627006 RepID=UPI0020CE0BCA|nr:MULTISPECIES: BadF/BadG/BcrA/BcrD ATPase family protein [unclassified Cyanobium]MCP9834219.1 N-acetylglucosamine kinase [Cyanobium sp. La Preciosa 7G6]MCP9936982.1 N-acetylglucosamine kinase [Cyanobium sp. Aljojuca 7A6]
MRLIAGFDAGQTHTSCRLALAGDGRVISEGDGPGVCHLAAPEGPARFGAALRESLARAMAGVESGSPPPVLVAAAVGASGIEQGSPVQAQGQALAADALGLPLERVLVTGDERTALRGAFPDGAGIVVISGTGTIAVGRDGRGREQRCAGWGWLLDGAGSAMDIGRDGLALSLQMADGRVPDSPLRHALWQALDLDPDDPGSVQRLKALVVAAGFGPAGFARLAPVLDQRAASGEAEAIAVMERNAAALAAMAAGVARGLDLVEPAVCPMGGALSHLEQLRRPFSRSLAQALPGSRLVTAAGDACQGALAMAAALLA